MRLQYELANAIGKENFFEEVNDRHKNFKELSDNVFRKNAWVLRLLKLTKDLEHSLTVMKDKSTTLLEAVILKEEVSGQLVLHIGMSEF